jgi:Domain of unknown function (DUF4331)
MRAYGMTSPRILTGTALLAALAGLVLAVLLIQRGPSAANAADHLDAPGLTPPGGSVQTDLTDIYAFRSPSNSAKTVLVLDVNGVASPGESAPGPDRPFAEAVPQVNHSAPVAYTFNVDNNRDARADVRVRARFGKPKKDGSQEFSLDVRRLRKGHHGGRFRFHLNGRSTAFGAAPVINRKDGVTVFAGRRDDPFFFDLPGFLNILGPGSLIGCGSSTSHPERDFFAHRNVSSLVVELPSSMLTRNSPDVGVWATTSVPGTQIDRMGRPAIATVFIPNNPIPPDRVQDGKPSAKSAFNHSSPADDQALWRGEVVDTLTTLFSLNDGTDPNPGDDAAKIQGLANFLLPDLLTVYTSSSAGFPNGRKPNDDVIDTELGLITEGAVATDCVPSDNTLPAGFPYLGNPN